MSGNRPRCGRCKKQGPLQPTMVGPRCKQCLGSLPPHLRRNPDQERPNAARGIRKAKKAGAGSTPPKSSWTAKSARRALKGKK